MASGWLIALGLLVAYVLFLFWLVQTGRLAKWNLSLMLGFALMVRTQRGKGAIEAIARPKRLWNAFGDLSTALVLLGMLGMTALFAFSVWFTLQPDSGVEALGASEILVIPGVNPFVPLWYGLIALIITLVVHEGGHGVLARANNMRLKSLGLLIAVVPIGAFVEPDEEDLKTSTRRKRLRVFAAGPAINIAVAMLCLGGFVAMVGAVEPHPGVNVVAVSKDSPADVSGIDPGDTLVAANGTPMPGWTEFEAFMEAQSPGDLVVFTFRESGDIPVVLGSRWDSLDPEAQDDVLQGTRAGMAFCRQRLEPDPATGPECKEGLERAAFLGMTPLPPLRFLSHPFASWLDFGALVSLPIGEVRGFPALSTYLPEFHDTPWGDDGAGATSYWITARLLFWVFWINLMVGVTNILPMVPLDGGHIFRDAVGGAIEKASPRADPRRVEKAVSWASGIVSVFILGAFLLQVFGPRFVGA